MSEYLKVLFLTHNYPRFVGDYSGIFLQLLAQKLKSYNINTVILAPHDKGTKEFEEIDGLRIYRFRYHKDDEKQNLAYRGNMQSILKNPLGVIKFLKFNSSFKRKAIEIIETEKIDLIAGHWLVPAGLVMKSMMKDTKLPMILSSHGTDIRLLKKFKSILLSQLNPLMNHISNWTVVSSFLKKMVIDTIPDVTSKLSILPPATNEELFYEDYSIERDPNLIVAVSRFTEQKRIPLLIKAFEKVCEHNSSARLEIYGSGPDENKIRDLIAMSSISDKITLEKSVAQDQLRSIYSRAGIVVLNSFEEGFGLVLTEAMLCGAAVIGTDSGGITDIITNNETGLLVAVDDINSLAKGINLLLEDNQLRLRLAKAGTEYAQSNFSSKKVAEVYASIIKAVIS